MASHKLFDDNAFKAIKVAHRRKWTLISLVLIICIVIIAFIIYHGMKVSQESVIANQYAEIDDIYNQENLTYQRKLQEQKRNSAPQIENSTPPVIEADYSTSMPKFRDFALKYPQNPYAWQAAIRSSTYFITNNKLDEAQKELEAVLPYTSRSTLLQIKIRTALAGIYADQNDIPKALAQLTIVENLPHNPLPNQSRFLKAQIFAATGNQAEAKKILNQIISTSNQNDIFSSQTNDIVHQARILLNKIGL